MHLNYIFLSSKLKIGTEWVERLSFFNLYLYEHFGCEVCGKTEQTQVHLNAHIYSTLCCELINT